MVARVGGVPPSSRRYDDHQHETQNQIPESHVDQLVSFGVTPRFPEIQSLAGIVNFDRTRFHTTTFQTRSAKATMRPTHVARLLRV